MAATALLVEDERKLRELDLVSWTWACRRSCRP